MKVHNPTEVVLICSKDNDKWEILPKSTVEFTQDQEVNLDVDPRLIVTEKAEVLSDFEVSEIEVPGSEE